jgi:DNA-directed RNA polymerase subunit K/omega
MPARHPAEVTADRIKDHYERWHDKLAPSEHTSFEVVIRALEEIAAGGR